MKMFVKKFTTSAVFVLLLAITAISGFIGVVSLFNGEYAKIAAEENDNDVVVSTNDNALTFAEMPQTRWYLAAYRLIYAHDDNYSNWTTNAMSTSYSENANRLGAYAINDEFFSVEGVDAEGSHRLEPVNSLRAANNITAVSYADITINDFRDVDQLYQYDNNEKAKIYINDDTRKLDDLTAEFRVAGKDAPVAKGKILYRSADNVGQTWGAWSYMQLTTAGTTIRFTKPYNQIAIIYELREEGPHWYNLYKYHHIIGIYRFNVAV